MQPLPASLAVLSLSLSLGCASPAPQADKPAVPSATSIEQLLRDRLAGPIQLDPIGLKELLRDPKRLVPAKPSAKLPSLTPYKNAELIAFKLLNLIPVSASRWQAEIDVQFDFGPPPPAVLGFERIRSQRFHLLLKQQGARLALLRFAPIARLHHLPAGN